MNEYKETGVIQIESVESDLILIKQLPVIEETLKTVSEAIEQRITEALSWECTDGTVKEVKKIRAELNKEFESLEKKRKEVKKAILLPYKNFEAVYKDCASDKYTMADKALKSKIDDVENGLKYVKESEIKQLFIEYAEFRNIGWLEFDRAKISVTLSASEKSLKEQVKKFIDTVADNEELIKLDYTPEETEEILVEYKKTLNVLEASRTVKERRMAIEAEKARIADNEAKKQAEQKAVEKVEQFAPPIEVEFAEEEDPICSAAFRVTHRLSELKKLKQIMIKGGFGVESIK